MSNSNEKKILIKGGRVWDLKERESKNFDILIEGKRISRIEDLIPKEEADILIDVRGLDIFPGFIDVHAHFREPGFEHKEDLETGVESAIRGGFTTVFVMPNTDPPLDDATKISYIRKRGELIGKAKIYPIGTVTKGRKGEELSEMFEMRESGAIAFSDDGKWISNSSIMRRALELTKSLKAPIISHAEDESLARGFAHEGLNSYILGIKGSPRESEDIAVFRDCLLASLTGGFLHIAHLSSFRSVEIVDNFKSQGVRVTSEVTPHHLTFNDEVLKTFDPNYKVTPPIREEVDRRALISGLKEGVIDCISTDHAPHAEYEKKSDFIEAPSGIISIQWAFAQLYTFLVLKEELDIFTILDSMTWKPRKIFKINEAGLIEVGGIADLCIVDLKKDWILDEKKIKSKSRNTPLIGEKLRGYVLYTLVEGKVFGPFEK